MAYFSNVACRVVTMQRPHTKAVSGQRLGKHIPAATDTNATIEELCFICGPCRDIISKEQD
jgi:hypothetical protein